MVFILIWKRLVKICSKPKTSIENGNQPVFDNIDSLFEELDK